MSDTDEVLFANEAFYTVFAGRDFDGMDALWARRERVTCIHPGWPPIGGREQVVESWRTILANPESPPVRCSRPAAHILGEAAYVVCYETFEGGFLIATNIFVREEGTWRMVHHQSGVAPRPEDAEEPEKPNTIQ